MRRPCVYCRAVHGEFADAEMCEFTHRDEERVYKLAWRLAEVFQSKPPTDEQVGWFLQDADAVVDDFDPAPDRWRVRTLPADNSEFDHRFWINDVTYVVPSGEGYIRPEPASIEVTFAARSDGHCGPCNLPISAGQVVHRLSNGRYVHQGCA